MTLLRRINVFISVILLSYMFFYIIGYAPELPLPVLISYTMMLFLFSGIEDFKSGKRKSGYFFIGTSLVLFIAVIIERGRMLLNMQKRGGF